MKQLVNILLLLLVWLLPWHTLIINGYLRDYFPFIVLWKEVSVVLLVVLAVTNHNKFEEQWKLLLIIVTVVLLIAHLFLNSIGIDAIYSFRIYLLPLLLIYVVIKLNDMIEWGRIINAFVLNAVIMAVFAIIQQLFFGEKIYLNAGYPTSDFSDEKLNFTFYIGYGLLQRGAGGFTAPIPYSVFLALALLLVSSTFYKDQKYAKGYNVVLLIGLLLTFTRSTIVAYIFFYILPRVNFAQSRTIRMIFLIIVIVIGQYFIVSDSIREQEISTLTIFWNNIVSMQDSSSVGHVDSLHQGIKLALDNWLHGLGLGSVGPHTAAFFKKALVIESGYLSVLIELGIFTSALIFILFPLSLYKKDSLGNIGIYIYLAVSLLLPLIYYVELSLLLILAVKAISSTSNYVDNTRQSLAGNIS